MTTNANAGYCEIPTTPCYVYDQEELLQNIQSFRVAFESKWGKNVIVAYSVKTAPIAGLISLADKEGCFTEVVSDAEFALALESGVIPSRIVFNGPIKSKDWLYFALDNGSVVNLDSQREIDWAIEYKMANNVTPRIGLRICLDIGNIAPGESITGCDLPRFGFSHQDGSLAEVISKLRDANIEPVGLHAHFSTKNHKSETFALIANQLCAICDELELQSLEYVDMGGGFYGGGKNRHMYEEYAKSIAASLKQRFSAADVTLILEPGGSILCTAGEYWGRVLDVKGSGSKRIIVTELSSLHLNPTVFGRRRQTCEVVFGDSQTERDSTPEQTLCGYTCMEMDRFADLIDFPALEVGDLIILNNAGAYSASFSPAFFIQGPPSVFIRESAGYRLLRESDKPHLESMR